MLDRHAASVGLELRDDLGNWIRRRLLKGVEGQGKVARTLLDQCGVPVHELREQWRLQCVAQLSIRARKYVSLPYTPHLISVFPT